MSSKRTAPKRGRGRPPKPDGERRVRLSVRVLPSTRAWLDRQGRTEDQSLGEVLDRLAQDDA